MSYIQDIYIELPDGSQGDLLTFYDAINSGEVGVSDDGFVLSDGSILETNGEPLYGVSEDELVILMEDYIVSDSNEPISEYSNFVVEPPKNNGSLLKLAAVGLLIYYLVK